MAVNKAHGPFPDGKPRPVQILLVEAYPGDNSSTAEAFKSAPVAIELHVVRNREAAIAYLRGVFPYISREPPDLVVLDLNLELKEGLEVLGEMRADQLGSFPAIVLTLSPVGADIRDAYHRQAVAFVTKPISFGDLLSAVSSIEGFWGLYRALSRK